MTIQEFLDQLSADAERIANDIFEYIDFLKHTKREHKSMREEYIPIRAYVRRKEIPTDAILELGGEAYDFDAKIIVRDAQGAREEVLEVVQALPKNEHIVRHALVKGAMNKELRELEMQQLRSFPQPIIDAINKKHKRAYADKRVLLVSVTGEHTYEDDALINEWIPYIKANTVLGNFAEIYLVETARYKLFKLH